MFLRLTEEVLRAQPASDAADATEPEPGEP